MDTVRLTVRIAPHLCSDTHRPSAHPPHPPAVLYPCLPQDLSTCEQSGTALAIQVKRRQKTKEQGTMGSMAAVTASGPQLAMGRVVSSLCVVTAKDEDYATGMLASWVSQVRLKCGLRRHGMEHVIAHCGF